MVLRHATSAIVFVSLGLAACGGQGNAERAVPGGPGSYVPPAPTMEWQPPEMLGEGTPVGQFGQLRVEGPQLLNAAGNPVQLKGLSTMWLNWESRLAGSKGGLEWMRDNWRLGVIRAAMGIEPAGAYLGAPGAAEAQVRTVVQNAIDLGVYVIIDWHDHNAHMHQAQAVEFFTKMAQDYGQFPNVIYEPYNEPENDDWNTVIKPYHEAVLAAIRTYDPDNIVVLGNPQWDQRPNVALANPVQGTNLMYALHFYACTHGATIRNNAELAHAGGLALFVTEWGATTADGGRPPMGATVGRVCTEAAQEWHDWIDQRNISWAAWRLQGCTNEQSCMFANAGVPTEGPWTSDMLGGHGPFVVDRMMD